MLVKWAFWSERAQKSSTIGGICAKRLAQTCLQKFENASLTPQLKQKRSTFGKKAKKGASWKFTLDLTHPVEDGILDSANFVGVQVQAFTSGKPKIRFSCSVAFYGIRNPPFLKH